MDVLKPLFGVALIFGLTACGSAKSTDSVFNDFSSSSCSGQKVENKFIVHWEDGSFTVETGSDGETFKNEFVAPNLERIRRVEFDRVIELDRQTEGDFSTSAVSIDWGQQIIETSSVWDQGYKGQNVLVGVVDSVVDHTNDQLATRIAVNNGDIPGNGLDDDGNGYVDDTYGKSFISNPGSNPTMNSHGTHVTGIIAADPEKGPVSGVAPKARFVAAPFITNDGSGSLGDAILAMQYAAKRGVRILNASWGGAPCVSSLRDAFSSLSAQGILLVVAAGNSSANLDRSPTYPAAFQVPHQITVAASNSSDFLAYFSNSGFATVHLAAPGAGIYSTVPGNSIQAMDGTSMAAPFVSGAAALLWSARPQATAAQIKQALLQSVEIRSNHEFPVLTQGRLNVRKALQSLIQILP